MIPQDTIPEGLRIVRAADVVDHTLPPHSPFPGFPFDVISRIIGRRDGFHFYGTSPTARAAPYDLFRRTVRYGGGVGIVAGPNIDYAALENSALLIYEADRVRDDPEMLVLDSIDPRLRSVALTETGRLLGQELGRRLSREQIRVACDLVEEDERPPRNRAERRASKHFGGERPPEPTGKNKGPRRQRR